MPSSKSDFILGEKYKLRKGLIQLLFNERMHLKICIYFGKKSTQIFPRTIKNCSWYIWTILSEGSSAGKHRRELSLHF
jgi:predicted nucleic acid-binding Zn finger protein